MIIGAMSNTKHFLGILLYGVFFSLCSSCQYNPQQAEQVIFSEPEVISLGSIQTPDTWSENALYSAFTLSVPNTMERSNTSDKYRRQLNNLGTPQIDGVVIFQQKSLNKSSLANADEHYCRVIVNYERATPGDLLHFNKTEEIDDDTRKWLFENVKGNIAYSQQLLSLPSYDWIDIGGTKAIRVKYRRSGNDGNTTACAMYYLFNYDEMAMVMTAYREQEASQWQCDMENVIRTFRWNKCK